MILRTNRSAFTLVEVIVAVTIMGVLMTAMGSVMIMASKSLPDGTTATELTIVGHDTLQQIAGELSYAHAVSERGNHAVAFSVADRNHGGVGPESIRYEWSGNPGDPLTRKYNNGTARTLVQNVWDFSLIYYVVDSSPADPTIETEELLLASNPSYVTALGYATTHKKWIGQFVEPQLPNDAIAWRVTHIVLGAKAHGNEKGITAVQLRPASANGLPGSTVLDETLLLESDLTDSFVAHTVHFRRTTGLPPSDKLCIILAAQNKIAQLGEFLYEATQGANRLITSDGGTTWTREYDTAMVYHLYGSATIPDPNPPPPKSNLHAISIVLQVGTDETTSVQTEIHMLNTPEVAG